MDHIDMDERKRRIEISGEYDGVRADKALSGCFDDISRSFIQKLIENGSFFVNGTVVMNKKAALCEGDVVEIIMPEPVSIDVVPENIPLDIVYEDSDVLVVNKEKGMVVHPAAGNYSGTLVNAVLHHCGDDLSSINGVIRPGIVHRIDKDTSGLLVIAKNDNAHRSLAEQLKEHSVTREYRAVVYNNFREDEGTVDEPIGRDPSNRLRYAVTYSGSKDAVTHYKVLERFGKYTYIAARLETGRTHQIRVHMSYIRHPLVGDELYGPSSNVFGVRGQMLHAGLLGFVHPGSGEYMEFFRDPPEKFLNVLENIRRKTNCR